MAKMNKGREKVKWTKGMQQVKEMDAAIEQLSAEDKELGLKLAGAMKWNKWTWILIVVGVLAGILGQTKDIQWAYYAAIVIWALAMACSYKFTKERNDVIVEHELKRKAKRDAEKAAQATETTEEK